MSMEAIMDAAKALTGLGVAIATPFFPDGTVDYQAFSRLVRFLAGKEPVKRGQPAEKSDSSGRGVFAGQWDSLWANESGGANFLVVLGSTGEGATIEPDERRKLIQTAVEEKTGLPMVVGTGSNSTAASVRLTAEAVSLGADAVLVVVPYYNKPTPEGLQAHYKAVAEAAGSKPVIVYNVPGRTGLNLAPAVLQKLWQIPNVIAVKESSGNLGQIGEIARTLPPGKILLSGDDYLALPSISLGAEGLISVAGNVLPRRFSALVEAARAGRRAEAMKLQHQLLPLMDSLFLESNPIPLKAALEMLGLASDFVRLPLFPAQAGTRQKLEAALAAILKSGQD